MFRQTINSTALTSDAANSYFQHIRGDNFNGDVTFLSTLRALIAPRMTDGESLRLHFHSSNYTKEQVESNSARDIIRAMCSNFNYSSAGQLYIHNIRNNPEDNEACIKVLQSNFGKIYNGWHRLPKVTDLFRTQFMTLCYINPELKSVIVFVDNLSIQKMHYLQCAILGFFPWYFSPEKGISQEEMNLINTLRAKNPDDYIECVVKIAEKYDFRTARIKQQLAGFETRYERMECDRVRGEIEQIYSNIEHYQDCISEQLNAKIEHEIRLLGLEAKIANGGEDSEIMDYFIHNKKLDLVSVDNNYMKFIVKDYISYFDEDVLKKALENPRSFVYAPDSRNCNNYIPSNKINELMVAIFIDQIIKIKVCAAYQFDLHGGVNAIRGYSFGSEYRGYMPNPHIQGYSCMGNYVRTINEALTKHDYITALEQTIASAKSINFTDGTVMSKFMRDFYGLGDNDATRASRKWFELPDGTTVTSAQAADWVWAQNHPDEQGENSDE